MTTSTLVPTTTPTTVPTVFVVSGDNTHIEYSTTSFVGRPSFEYKTDHTVLQFSGDEIRLLRSEFATLVTVTVGGENDAGDTTLTLLIPTITVTQKEPEARFETKAILMTVRRLGAVHQHYRVLNLHGTAEAIDF